MGDVGWEDEFLSWVTRELKVYISRRLAIQVGILETRVVANEKAMTKRAIISKVVRLPLIRHEYIL